MDHQEEEFKSQNLGPVQESNHRSHDVVFAHPSVSSKVSFRILNHSFWGIPHQGVRIKKIKKIIHRLPCSLIGISLYYDMMFFVLNEGYNPWINFVYAGLIEIPPLLVATLFVKYCPRRLFYVLLYLVTGAAAAGILFTTDGEAQKARLACDAEIPSEFQLEGLIKFFNHLILQFSLLRILSELSSHPHPHPRSGVFRFGPWSAASTLKSNVQGVETHSDIKLQSRACFGCFTGQ